MKIQTSELTGATLDWAVACCQNVETDERHRGIFRNDRDDRVPYSPSTDWAQGGPIIEREKIELVYFGEMGMGGCPWEAQIGKTTHYIDQGPGESMGGPTPLRAAMRCYVASKLGDAVSVPDELCGASL